MDWLVAQAESATSRQRYKGLGEMNPAQLWGNHHGPKRAPPVALDVDDAMKPTACSPCSWATRWSHGATLSKPTRCGQPTLTLEFWGLLTLLCKCERDENNAYRGAGRCPDWTSGQGVKRQEALFSSVHQVVVKSAVRCCPISPGACPAVLSAQRKAFCATTHLVKSNVSRAALNAQSCRSQRPCPLVTTKVAAPGHGCGV